MKNVAPFHKRALIGADNRPEDKFESAVDKFGDAFIEDIATRDKPVVSWTFWALGLCDQGDGCHIPSLRENPRVEEVLYSTNHVRTYDWPRSFVEATVEPVKTGEFVLRDTPDCLFNLLPREE